VSFCTADRRKLESKKVGLPLNSTVFIWTKFHENSQLHSTFIMGGRKEMCGHDNNISLFNPDKIWNIGFNMSLSEN
jgi:hypothetical protein